MKLYLDPGHGGTDPGAQGNGIKEKDITLDIAKRIRAILTDEYDGIEVRMSRTDDSTKSLAERTNEANSWKADYFCPFIAIRLMDRLKDMKTISTTAYPIHQRRLLTETRST